jgi:hypothetical protein
MSDEGRPVAPDGPDERIGAVPAAEAGERVGAGAAAESGGPAAAAEAGRAAEATGSAPPRPLIERIGMAAIALVLAALFGAVAVAAWFGGEIFLAAMGAIGCLMTLWVGALTLFRR